MNRKRWILPVAVGSSLLIGILITIIVTANFDFTKHGIASNTNGSKAAYIEASEQSSVSAKDLALIDHINKIFVQAAKKVKPSVVTIYSEKVIKVLRYRSPFDFFFGDDFFNQFFQQSPRERSKPQTDKYIQQGMGSGVIIRSDGYILTNYHVVKEADDIRVITTDRKKYEAKVVGTDPKTDLALLKIDASNLPAAILGDSDKLQVGEWVLAIGNPFSERFHHTVTKGIVSAKGRTFGNVKAYENFIQTDAPINPGNSGGALVNLRGEVVGINSAIVTPTGAFAGMGFAIPINMAKKVVKDLMTKGKVVRGWLGVYIQPVDEDLAKALGLRENRGALVVKVQEDSPAEKAGIQTSDVIIKFNGVEVENPDHLKILVGQANPGTKVKVVVNRDGKLKTFQVTLGELPGEQKETKLSKKAKEKLGIEVQNLTADLARRYGYEKVSGVIITSVDPTSVAGRKGLREGDLIKEVNRQKINNVREYEAALEKLKPGDVVLFLIQRGESNLFVAMEIPKK
ncbi:DegQ family serine endoprotease [candidate division KSB1 bacterium]|nr:MAG: DegQ family serine endoprotease [candidate division KSB1 bacterium]RKY79744.1 MAG: DegQ family serine endoprotease [candidate division KSB1 bacterium]RKY93083.1 MAG: DegQ family serine endoprotease [candidate division KSB1 bacterium]